MFSLQPVLSPAVHVRTCSRRSAHSRERGRFATALSTDCSEWPRSGVAGRLRRRRRRATVATRVRSQHTVRTPLPPTLPVRSPPVARVASLGLHRSARGFGRAEASGTATSSADSPNGTGLVSWSGPFAKRLVGWHWSSRFATTTADTLCTLSLQYTLATVLARYRCAADLGTLSVAVLSTCSPAGTPTRSRTADRRGRRGGPPTDAAVAAKERAGPRSRVQHGVPAGRVQRARQPARVVTCCFGAAWSPCCLAGHRRDRAPQVRLCVETARRSKPTDVVAWARRYGPSSNWSGRGPARRRTGSRRAGGATGRTRRCGARTNDGNASLADADNCENEPIVGGTRNERNDERNPIDAGYASGLGKEGSGDGCGIPAITW